MDSLIVMIRGESLTVNTNDVVVAMSKEQSVLETKELYDCQCAGGSLFELA